LGIGTRADGVVAMARVIECRRDRSITCLGERRGLEVGVVRVNR
jgi:hypothetical protein